MTKNKVDQDAKKLREAVSNERKEESTASNGKKEKIDVIAKLGRRLFGSMNRAESLNSFDAL